jgi:hypothetical protein
MDFYGKILIARNPYSQTLSWVWGEPLNQSLAVLSNSLLRAKEQNSAIAILLHLKSALLDYERLIVCSY